MFSALDNALSGLTAYTRRLDVTADNIANQETVGRVGVTEGPDAAYKAQTTTNVSGPTGGVQAVTGYAKPPTVLSYAPGSPLANDQGQVEAPNVDTATQIVDLTRASSAYRANLAVARTADDMLKQVTSIIT